VHYINIIIKNIEKASEKPFKFLQASAAGFYGSSGDTVLTEESLPVDANEPGTKFRVAVCKEIEERANQANCNVINLRIGHVLSNDGGLLPYCKLSGFFNVARFGSGEQFVPFIHIKDAVKAIEFIASSNSLVDGPINLTAPEPCRNSEMLRELSLIKSAPIIPVPETLLKLIIGDSAVVLLDSERVIPKRLLESGFQFEYNNISKSLHGLK
jgi:nucleoside-diphosphate-sugar epimerase